MQGEECGKSTVGASLCVCGVSDEMKRAVRHNEAMQRSQASRRVCVSVGSVCAICVCAVDVLCVSVLCVWVSCDLRVCHLACVLSKSRTLPLT